MLIQYVLWLQKNDDSDGIIIKKESNIEMNEKQNEKAARAFTLTVTINSIFIIHFYNKNKLQQFFFKFVYD